MIDRREIDQDLSPIHRSAAGEKAWPPLAMLKALLLAVWYDLRDVKLAEALDDRASFRRFCGFAASEPTLERTAFVRFRRKLEARSRHRYKAHVATDAEGGIVRCIEMTPANVNDGRMLRAVLPPDPGSVHADLADASSRNEILIRDAGGSSRLPGRAVWSGPEALEKLEAWRRNDEPSCRLGSEIIPSDQYVSHP